MKVQCTKTIITALTFHVKRMTTGINIEIYLWFFFLALIGNELNKIIKMHSYMHNCILWREKHLNNEITIIRRRSVICVENY